ncbi:DUF7694 domain-containing protein [Paraburkholderia susongensis]|nr:hypothetical protein [Paraburkholderia susongensis]
MKARIPALLRMPVQSAAIALTILGQPYSKATVAGEKRCPLWSEMAWVKDQFFEPCEAVMQLHPPREQYVNNHPYCLHMWRPHREAIPLPPVTMVGIAGMTPQQLAQMNPEDIERLRAVAVAGWKWSGS